MATITFGGFTFQVNLDADGNVIYLMTPQIGSLGPFGVALNPSVPLSTVVATIQFLVATFAP